VQEVPLEGPGSSAASQLRSFIVLYCAVYTNMTVHQATVYFSVNIHSADVVTCKYWGD
jgi:hypothetical protein